jgi:hypothetical protein
MGFKIFNVNNLLQSLDSVAASIDSNNNILQMLQVIDATYDSAYGGRKKYYDSEGALPVASSALKGMTAVVLSGVPDSGNALYICRGGDWSIIQDLNDSV